MALECFLLSLLFYLFHVENRDYKCEEERKERRVEVLYFYFTAIENIAKMKKKEENTTVDDVLRAYICLGACLLPGH